MSSNIGQYIQTVHDDTAKMQKIMEMTFDANRKNDDAMRALCKQNMNKTFDHLKGTLETAIKATENDNSAVGKRAYEGFNTALKDLMGDYPPKAGAVQLGRAYQAQKDVDNIDLTS